MNDDLREQMNTLATQMKHFHASLEVKARDMEMAGGDSEVISKLINGADAMRDSANIYLSWARHYVNLSEGGASEAEEGEEDSADFQF